MDPSLFMSNSRKRPSPIIFSSGSLWANLVTNSCLVTLWSSKIQNVVLNVYLISVLYVPGSLVQLTWIKLRALQIKRKTTVLILITSRGINSIDKLFFQNFRALIDWLIVLWRHTENCSLGRHQVTIKSFSCRARIVLQHATPIFSRGLLQKFRCWNNRHDFYAYGILALYRNSCMRG